MAIIIGVIIVCLAAVVASYYAYKKRRQREAQKMKEAAIRHSSKDSVDTYDVPAAASTALIADTVTYKGASNSTPQSDNRKASYEGGDSDSRDSNSDSFSCDCGGGCSDL